MSCMFCGQLMHFEAASFSLAHGKENEDSTGISTLDDLCLVAIADGVGSSERSREASRIAVDTALATIGILGIIGMQEAFENARKALTSHAHAVGAKSMSTTLTVCGLIGDSGFFGHVGDTRLYHLRGIGLETRTIDQTEVQHLIAEGVITRERARRYPRKNVLLSAVSSSSMFDLQLGQFAIEPGDRIVLATDGFHKLVSKRRILDQSRNSPSLSTFVDGLKVAAESTPLTDDTSVVCVEVSA